MNSRLRISNHSEVTAWATKLSAIAMNRGTRALMVVNEAPDIWLAQLAAQVGCIYLPRYSTIDRADRISALLGSEHDKAIIQLGHSPDLGLLASVAGTMQAGGVLILATAPATSHARLSTDETLNSTEVPPEPSHSTQRLEKLTLRLSEQHPETVKFFHFVTNRNPAGNSTKNEEDGIDQEVGTSTFKHSKYSDAYEEQSSLLRQACEHLSAQPTSLTMISGLRGRGKSTLLARIALHLHEIDEAFHITAMHESALRAFTLHASQVSDRFISPEAATTTPTNILMVDEAASFSLTLLQQYAQHYRHLILCSTTEGYEASGRALDVRFLSSEFSDSERPLLHLKPVWRWRWNDHDPLELFINRLLLKQDSLNVLKPANKHEKSSNSTAQHCHVKRITQRDLIDDDILLADIHALLRSTHYQTTTKDLEHLLDAPSLQIWAQLLETRVVGVLLLEIEGQLPRRLHEDILSKKRRLKNQLLPQLLAQVADDGSALHLCYARVVRIAVTPQMRRQGLATALVNQLVKLTAPLSNTSDAHTTDANSTNSYDAIGASFASDPCSIAFWESVGFSEFHRGFRSNPRTGKRAVAMLRCFEPVSDNVLQLAIDIHQDNERVHKSENPAQATDTIRIENRKRDFRLLIRFADGQRSLHDTRAAIQRLSIQDSLPIDKKLNESTKQYELRLRACVKQSIVKHRADS